MAASTAMLQALTHFRRVGGQYARYYGTDYASYLVGVKTPAQVARALTQMQFDVEQQQIAKRVEEREAREEAARQEREAAAMFEINNVKARLEGCISQVRGAAAKEDVRQSVEIMNRIIDDSVDRYGAETAVEWLRPWATNFENTLERLAFAIYDKEYNTNDRWYHVDPSGALGRSKYHNDMENFALNMGVSLPTIYFA